MNLSLPIISAISKLCETHRVKALYAFGSVLSDQQHSESDVDLIVEFAQIAPEEYADNYYDLKFALQDLFKRSVDLLEEQAIRNPYFRQSIDQRKKLVYGL